MAGGKKRHCQSGRGIIMAIYVTPIPANSPLRGHGWTCEVTATRADGSHWYRRTHSDPERAVADGKRLHRQCKRERLIIRRLE